MSVAADAAYPSKPIRVLVGFSPGGGTDVAIRIIGKRLSEMWNQQVIIDNRPGAGGLLAFDIVAKANPDGYTLLATSPSFAIQPGLTPKLPYDPIRDFAPITVASASPYLLVLHPGVEAKSVKDLVALAKANPGKLNYASGGLGSAQHLVTELFRLMAGIDIVHVPYKGAVSVPDVIAGRVQLLMSGVPQALAHVQAGRLRAIGVTTPRRAALLPNVPTIAEAGVPGYQVTVWYGILATGRTPKPVLDKLNSGFVQAIHSPEVRQQLSAMGLDAVGSSSAEFTATVHGEIRQWADVIKRAGIKPE
jgi:tripartite-type tricarboxylate transporter receptor subunit TctC